MFSASTYTKTVMSFGPDNAVVTCNERLRGCLKYARSSPVAMSYTHTTIPSSTDLRRISEAVTRSKKVSAKELKERTTDLILESEVTLRAGEGRHLVFGGQYLHVPADTTIRVDLDIEASDGTATANLRNVVNVNGYKRFERKRISLRKGGRVKLSYEFYVREESHSLVCELNATASGHGESKLIFHNAKIGFRQGGVRTKEPKILEERTEKMTNPIAPSSPN